MVLPFVTNGWKLEISWQQILGVRDVVAVEIRHGKGRSVGMPYVYLRVGGSITVIVVAAIL